MRAMLDFIGIGLGPFNLSLASLLQDKTRLKYQFFEQKAQFDWHAGMQLPDTVLQVPFMADLVSMVDPTSPYSFLNYLKAQQRLYKFYFLERSQIPRREYNHYCQWVADQLSHIQYQSTVKAIYAKEQGFEVVVEQGGVSQHFLCRHLVIGSGNVPHLPACLQHLQQQHPEQCLHSATYLNQTGQPRSGNVVVLGSGQSAAEVFMDLFDQQYAQERQPRSTSQALPYKLHWLTRSNGFFPMEYAPLGLEHFSPDYTAHFYQLSPAQKADQLKQQALLYKGISAQTIREIYQKLYHRSIGTREQMTHLHAQSHLKHAQYLDGKIQLHFQHTVTQQQFVLHADCVVAATGYASLEFEFLKPLKPFIHTDAQGHWKVQLDYRLSHDALGEIYVQNQELHTHGVGTPDLGLGACRAAQIANQLAGYPLYEVSEQAQCFQHFQPENNPELSLLTTTAQVVPMQEHFCIKKPISRAQVFESKSQQPQKNNAFEKIL